MLWQLAARNVRRNWSQTLLGLIGVAIAAGVMTASLSLGAGYPEIAHAPHRVLTGADIVVYPGQLGVGEEDAAAGGRESWEWSLRRDGILSDLARFQPDLFRRGYIHPPDQRVFFDPEELPGPLGPDERPPGVVDVQPLFKLPARLLEETVAGKQVYSAPLRARNVQSDRRREVDPYVHRGRWLEPEDAGEFVALMQGVRGAGVPAEGTRPEYGVPGLLDVVTVEVPSLVGYAEGHPVWDWSDVQTIQLEVVGLFSFPAGEKPYIDEETGSYVRDSEGRMLMVPQYLETEDIFIPEETWRNIWHEVSGGEKSPRAYQLNVVLEDMSRAEEIAAQLGDRLSGMTVRSIPEQVRIGARARGQTGVPADMSAVLLVAMFLVAGLLLVANMYVLIMQRRKEMAILKAVGMSGQQVMALILIEVLFIGIVGAVLGFAAVRLAVTGVLLASEVTAAEIGILTLRTGLLVVGAGTLMAVMFGVLPAYLAMKQTTMEVLRDA